MVNLMNLDIAIAAASFFVFMVIFAYCFGEVYDWWYARKKRRRKKFQRAKCASSEAHEKPNSFLLCSCVFPFLKRR
jgi:cbb3-type cytochrome oxidase subunit 3